MVEQVDVVVVGAGIAGCAAATLYGRHGLNVLLLEAHRDAATFKRTCTHYIQPSALPTMQRLGLDERIEAAGGLRNGGDLWTPYGWTEEKDAGLWPPYGYNLRRSVLDPLLRTMAAETPEVRLALGSKVTELLRSDGRVSGVVITGLDGQRQEIQARLVVGADGCHSVVAGQAGLPARTIKHSRFCYFAYYTGVHLDTTASSQMWLTGPGVAYTFTNDAGHTVLAAVRPKQELEEFRKDLEGNLLGAFKNLPRSPDLSGAQRVSDIIGVINYPSIIRRPAAAGVALIGDAALVADYVWGVGCGWALQMAEWLVDATTHPLLHGGDVDAALKHYARQHRARLWPHQFILADFARRQAFNPIERLLYAAVPVDAWVARRGAAVHIRSASPVTLLSPLVLGRAAAARLRRGRLDRSLEKA